MLVQVERKKNLAHLVRLRVASDRFSPPGQLLVLPRLNMVRLISALILKQSWMWWDLPHGLPCGEERSCATATLVLLEELLQEGGPKKPLPVCLSYCLSIKIKHLRMTSTFSTSWSRIITTLTKCSATGCGDEGSFILKVSPQAVLPSHG